MHANHFDAKIGILWHLKESSYTENLMEWQLNEGRFSVLWPLFVRLFLQYQKMAFLWAVDSFHRLVIVRNFSVFTELPPHLSEKDSQLQNSDFFILCVLEMERCEMPLWSHNPDEIFRNRKENRTPPTSQRLKIFRKKLFNAMEGFFCFEYWRRAIRNI